MTNQGGLVKVTGRTGWLTISKDLGQTKFTILINTDGLITQSIRTNVSCTPQ
jgi:hypothetical protein